MPEQVKRRSGASEAYRELIELELSRGRNAMVSGRIWSIVAFTDERPWAQSFTFGKSLGVAILAWAEVHTAEVAGTIRTQ
jgi:hypothetical protein